MSALSSVSGQKRRCGADTVREVAPVSSAVEVTSLIWSSLSELAAVWPWTAREVCWRQDLAEKLTSLSLTEPVAINGAENGVLGEQPVGA